MDKSNIEIILSSDSKYEKLTAEIFYNKKFVALLNQDEGKENIKIEFPGANVQENMVLRDIDLGVFEEAIKLGVKKLKES